MENLTNRARELAMELGRPESVERIENALRLVWLEGNEAGIDSLGKALERTLRLTDPAPAG